jgi:hypothetical protein
MWFGVIVGGLFLAGFSIHRRFRFTKFRERAGMIGGLGGPIGVAAYNLFKYPLTRNIFWIWSLLILLGVEVIMLVVYNMDKSKKDNN